MNAREKWEHFVQVDALPHRTEQIRNLYKYFCEHKDLIAQEFVLIFDQFCQNLRRIQDAGEMQKCACIHISLLRTSMIEGQPVYMLEAFDIETLDRVKLSPFRYHAYWIFSFMNKLEDLCDADRRKYAGQIDRPMLEAWMKEQVFPFHEFMVHAVRYAMDRVVRLASFRSIEKEVLFEIRVCEYRDQNESESVYRINESKKMSVSCKGWLECLFDHDYIYEHIQDVDVSYGQYAGINLNYARLENVGLTQSNMRNSYLLGSKFEACRCDLVDFSGSTLFDADFRNCNLEQARFDHVLAQRNLMNEKRGMIFGIHGVNFQGANLTNASFRGARLAGDFLNAALNGTDFTDADLTGSYMLKRDADRVLLSGDQRQSISWVEGNAS
ncbi:pentapeptide repeat-containing protein [Cohnella terricola]|nr:pentapeptide repeat-containing protein [Cohnella terricola]